MPYLLLQFPTLREVKRSQHDLKFTLSHLFQHDLHKI